MMMTQFTSRALAIALAVSSLAAAVPAAAATTAPKATPHAVPRPPVPTVPLHTEFVVEVNAKGQVVRVKSGKACKDVTFNAQTYGNVLQMWIRRPDGTAEVGLYKVTYDYEPKRHTIHRGIALVKAGGSWGNQEGAATQMIETAQREAKEAQEKAKHEGKSLPPLQSIVGPSSKPTSHP